MCNVCEKNKSLKLNENFELKEWLGFNYEELLEEIKIYIDNDTFELLRAASKQDLKLGLLNEKQISQLKIALKEGFENGKSILDIADDIKYLTNLPDRKIMQNGKLYTYIDKNVRSILIARTESTRAANGGSILRYKDAGIEQYRWSATLDGRTSAICESLNGRIFDINSGVQPPAHVNCRSTLIPIVPGFDEL